MRRRLLAGLLGALALPGAVQAQGVSAPGIPGAPIRVGVNFPPAATSGGGGYVGPGDVVPGATYFWGLRAYSAAVAASGAQAAVRVTRATDGHACDILIATDGGLGNTANCSDSGDDGTPAASWGASTTVTVTTWYNQTGVGDYKAANDSSGPTLIFDCVNSKPCLAYGSGKFLESFLGPAIDQPLSVSVVAIRTGGFSAQNDLVKGAATNGVFFAASSDKVEEQFGSPILYPASDNAWHAFQFVANSTASAINVDGADAAGQDFGTGGYSNDFYVGGGPSNYLFGSQAEAGIWPLAFSSIQRAALCQNQTAYFGVTASC